MKKVLILVVSGDFPPYDKMIQTSLETWDSRNIDNVQTLFYCGLSKKNNTDKIIYLPIKEGLYQMGYKTIAAFEYAVKNYDFDYIVRCNSSHYVRKHELLNHCNELPDSIFQGLITPSVYGVQYAWGGLGYIISRDLVECVIASKTLWNHSYIEDVSISDLITRMGFDLNGEGNGYSINKADNGWTALVYGKGESFEFTDFADLKRLDQQYIIRVKQDLERDKDEFIMRKLYESGI